MRTRFNLRYLLISALFFSLQLCRGQIAPVVFDFGTTTGTQLWDLTGAYGVSFTINQPSGLEVPVAVSFTLIQDAAGNLRGAANDFQLLTIGSNASFTVSYTITGKVTGSGGAARARFTVHMVGNGNIGGIGLNSMSAFLVVDAVPDSEGGQLNGVARFSANFSSRSLPGLSGSVTDFTTPLPPNVDGTWTLLLLPSSLNNSAAGLAAVYTSTGQSFGFIFRGPFRGDVFNMSLKGSSNISNVTMSGVGSNARALFDPSFDLLQFNGKLMGQSVLISPD